MLPCAPLPLPLLLLVLLRGAVLAACLLRASAGAVAAAARSRGGGLPAIPRTTAVLLGALRQGQAIQSRHWICVERGDLR